MQGGNGRGISWRPPAYSLFEKLLPAGFPRNGKLLVLNLLKRQKSGFSPRRGNSIVAPIHVKIGRAEGYLGPLAVQNFTSIAIRGENAAPKCPKFLLFGKESPRSEDSQGGISWRPPAYSLLEKLFVICCRCALPLQVSAGDIVVIARLQLSIDAV